MLLGGPSRTPPIRRFEQRPETSFSATGCCVDGNPVPTDDIGDLIPIHADDMAKHEDRALIGCQLRHRRCEVRVGVEPRRKLRFDTDLRYRRSEMFRGDATCAAIRRGM